MTDRYRWVALSNTTLGMLLATLNASSLIIALPVVLAFAACMCLGAAVTSWLRGGKFVHEEAEEHLSRAA